MILSVTLNPLLERRFIYEKIFFGQENRNGKEELKAGGKGINVSRQLTKVGIDNLSFTFIGGPNGKLLKELLTNDGIKFSFVRTKSESRYAAVAVSNKSITTFFSENSSVIKSEADEFLTKLSKMIQNCELVIFSGSSSCPETDHIFPEGISLANRYDKISFCDTYGKHFPDCIEAGPTIIHNNILETENSTGRRLNSENKIIEYSEFLYSKNIKQIFLTNGNESSICSNFNYHYRINNPDIEAVDATGSGDSFCAGIIYGLHNNLTFEQSILTAASFGIANAVSPSTSNVVFKEAGIWKDKIIIEPIGKKMKTIDVTPH